jgi:hypothetical protein
MIRALVAEVPLALFRTLQILVFLSPILLMWAVTGGWWAWMSVLYIPGRNQRRIRMIKPNQPMQQTCHEIRLCQSPQGCTLVIVALGGVLASPRCGIAGLVRMRHGTRDKTGCV